MIDNTKEYIVCAAYKQTMNTTNRQYLIDNGRDPKRIYREPSDEVFDIRLGYRHPDIIYQFGEEINHRSDEGGFMTSKGRYVDRREAMKIALECGQVTEEKALKDDGTYNWLFSEDIY